jgi:hypothetical protein
MAKEREAHLLHFLIASFSVTFMHLFLGSYLRGVDWVHLSTP